MGHLQKQIYKGTAWVIETTHGTEFVPCDVQDVAHKDGMPVDESEAKAMLRDFVNGDIIEIIERRDGWLGRWSAPGYMDSTEWGLYRSEVEAKIHLDSL